MQKITQEFLKELSETQEKLADIYFDLLTSIEENEDWKSQNIGAPAFYMEGEVIGVEIDNSKNKINIRTFGFDDRDECDKECWYTYNLDELLNDNWKEKALKVYQKEYQKRQEEQQRKDKATAEEAEAMERAEYERLKAKFEH